MLEMRWTLKLALLLTLDSAQAAFAAEQWLKINSSNFELFTTAGEKKGREAILYLEQVRSLFAKSWALTGAGGPAGDAGGMGTGVGRSAGRDAETGRSEGGLRKPGEGESKGPGNGVGDGAPCLDEYGS
jgi:hypothetical protein